MFKTFLIILVGILPFSLTAQQTLSLDACRELALQNNKKLKIAEKEVYASKAMKEQAFTKYLPSVDASGLYLRNQKKMNLLEEDAHLPLIESGQLSPTDFALLPKSAMSIDSRNVAMLQVGLTQPIFLGGKIRAYNQLAGIAEQISLSKRDLEIENLIVATDEAYWQVISLINRQLLAGKYVETLQKLSNDVELMYKNGTATKADVLSVKVKLNESEMLRFKVDDGLTLSRMHLNQICGLSTDTVYPLQDENQILNSNVSIPKTDLDKVYAQRPEITSLSLAAQASEKQENIILSDYLPTVALTANYITHTPNFYNGISTKFEGMWSVGVGMKIPVFHWGESRKNVRQQKAKTEIYKYQLEEAKENIELQVNQSEFKIKETGKKVEMAEYNLKNAEENLKLANLGFKEGSIAASTLMEAQTAWLAASSDLIDAKIEMKLAEVYLQKAYGNLIKK
ncbi:MAG: TolC family protein [Culturomica sp.]|jgi:outer membrane protein TolC|nr:TolC family protein [Culturomica sp.]